MRAAMLCGTAAALAVLCPPAARAQTRAAKVGSAARSGVAVIGPINAPLGPSSLDLAPLSLTAGDAGHLPIFSAPAVAPGMSAHAAAARSEATAAESVKTSAALTPRAALRGSLGVIAAVKTAAGGDLRAELSPEAITPSPEVLNAPSAGRDWAADSFESLAGGGAPGPRIAGAGVEAPASRGWTALKPALLVDGGRPAASSPPKTAGQSRAEHPFWKTRFGRALGWVLSYLVPFPDVVASVRQVNGHSRDAAPNRPPVKDTVQAGLSIVVGLINAVLSRALWGIFGIFGGLIMLPVLIARWALARRAAGPAKPAAASSSLDWHVGWSAPVKKALVMTVLLLAASAALYFGAAAALPALLAHWLAPALVTKLIFWIRAGSIAVNFAFFLPPAIRTLRRWHARRAARPSPPQAL